MNTSIRFNNVDIPIKEKLTSDLTNGIMVGYYITCSYALYTKTLTSDSNLVFQYLNKVVNYKDIPKELTDNKYLTFKGKNITPYEEVNSNQNLIHWVLADLNNKEFMFFTFRTGDFIRGVMSMLNTFNIDVNKVMFNSPFIRIKEWTNVHLTVTNDKDSVIVNIQSEDTSYIPYVKYSKPCNSNELKTIVSKYKV